MKTIIITELKNLGNYKYLHHRILYGRLLFIQVLTNVIQKDTSTLSDLYYAVNGLTALSQKVPAARIDKLVKLIQAALRKDDSLWK